MLEKKSKIKKNKNDNNTPPGLYPHSELLEDQRGDLPVDIAKEGNDPYGN